MNFESFTSIYILFDNNKFNFIHNVISELIAYVSNKKNCIKKNLRKKRKRNTKLLYIFEENFIAILWPFKVTKYFKSKNI